MAAKLEGDVIDNGRPVKTSPVIRRVEVAEEDTASRVLTRLVPAFVLSGAIHVVLIGFFVLFMASPKDANAKQSNDLATTQVEDPKEDEKNLTNEDVGFDPDLAAATNADREEAVNVEAPKSDDPVGLPEQQSEIAPLTQMAGPGADLGQGAVGDLSPSGEQMAGPGGGAGAFTTPGMIGRSGATKDKLLKAGGGNSASEAAVAAGLHWLARQQEKDGSWKFDGVNKNRIAATGMALLPFLAAGETHKYGTKYKQNVEKGLNYLTSRVTANGSIQGVGGPPDQMYAHAIATIALCEAAGMTKDPAVKSKAAAALGFIVKAQGKNGSWGYAAGAEGDTSIVGWQVQALASGRLAEIKFDKDKVYKDANRFLESVSTDSGAKYGYRERGASQSLTPVGLLSRYYMGEMNPRHPAFGRGVDFLKQYPPRKEYWDMYYYYYATQVVHFFEGPDWHKFWNPKMRDLLVDLQNKSGDEAKKGSWDKDSGFIGSACGRLGTTCLALLTLEVYYRHLPLYKRDSGGLTELEMK
ncbi:MAG: terpene cyclase/mutase family protein [Zavarzinella sp.]|nr:terpene cyclase/mutase family protein [Zavarzinella sp.]